MNTPNVDEQITGISSMATRRALTELAQGYQLRFGRRMAVVSVGGVDAARRVRDGEAFDFVVLAADTIDSLVAGGHVTPTGRVDFARSGVAIAVAAGATRPDISSELAVKEAVLASRRIGYSTGPSGAHLMRLFERWGIAKTVAPRTIQAPPGVPVGDLLARGEVALGFQQLSELMHMPGIDVLGPLPSEIQTVTVFAAGVCVSSAQPEAAREALAFLAAPEADAAKRDSGMEPAR